ncbi:hypothetical protein SDRG_12549 [Saprolegnia diclina VS20]|uniref:Elicitin n=1 Tax=Saprolegnia diclina (strain VS20) TaxID=1156394 RepID=T0RC33_SAPDV|nr:hypothetical protein SDRG_12549 [Saprolegnia diclina VS20]EQC29778.1 hypothetical protein SDRG_12549 [Saprolegnia diclina VS20]|eukprot:XP_008616844.1 hypothetical protein SDRG_12549 [Saprolegnia diclina VS20]
MRTTALLAFAAVAAAHGGNHTDAPAAACTEAQTANVTKWFTAPIEPGCTAALATIKSPLQLIANITDADLLKVCGNKACMTYIHAGIDSLPNCVATVGATSGNANAALDAAHDKCHDLMKSGDSHSSGSKSTGAPAITTVPGAAGNKTTPAPTAPSAAAATTLSVVAMTAVAAAMMQ